jgi:transposase InsO family protein
MGQESTDIPLPKAWPKHARSAIVHVIAMARTAIVYARAKAASMPVPGALLRAKLDNARAEIALLREELRIKDARMAALEPRRRPYYRPTERMSIVELRAARGWSTAETARVFLVQPATVAAWWKRVDEQGDNPLLETPAPVNRFPEFVRHIVCRLKVLQPTLGKKRIAQMLARAGLHIGVTTVKRMLDSGRADPAGDGGKQGHKQATLQNAGETQSRPNKPVISNRPDHVWQVDLTVVPTSAGLWVPWLPNALAQRWPFCWWVAFAIDHYSRQAVGFAVFAQQPTSLEVRSFLGRAIAQRGQSPKYIISDLGGQFDCEGYRSWCDRRGIEYRYSSADSLAATAVVERFIKSIKEEMLRLSDVPLRRDELRAQIVSYLTWFHEHRPHQGLGGRTPNEVCSGERPANEKARFEPRALWPRRSPCALPTAAQRGTAGRLLEVVVTHHNADARLPVVEFRRAA